MMTFLVCTLLALGAALAGRLRWRAGRSALREELTEARLEPQGEPYDGFRLEGLPPPVQRYLRAALKPGRPLVAAASLRQTGTFNLSATGERWRPFTATQRVVTRRPGFLWEARIAMAPGLAVHVHDAYVAGEGCLQAALGGFYALVRERDAHGLAQGELLRYLAETAWYPTALLPGQGVAWEPVDDHSATATLRDGPLTASLRFHFNDEDRIASIRAEARIRKVGDLATALPWEGRFWNYTEVEGMVLPLEGEVAWVTPEGVRPYWRGRVTEVTFDPGPTRS
jgi:hypothetical protein